MSLLTARIHSGWALARAVHQKQMDEGGNAYLMHVIRVVNAVSFFGDEDTTLIAMMHDVLESHPTPNYIGVAINKLFGKDVLRGVQQLTRLGNEEYARHIGYVCLCPKEIVAIKLAEVRDNLDMGRLSKPWTAQQIDRQRWYHAAFAALTDSYQKKLGQECDNLS